MARPTGWDILGLDGDPTPGVVESVQALAKEFGDFAHDVESAYRSLNSFGSDTAAMQWVGQTADAFKSQFGPLPGRLQKLYTSYSEASDALSAYAPQLQAAQTKADAALRQAQDAHADLQRATTNANNAATDLKTAQQNHAANPEPAGCHRCADRARHRADQPEQRQSQDGRADQAGQRRLQRPHQRRQRPAPRRCTTPSPTASTTSHWWEHVGEDLSEWGGKIAEIANELAPFLDVLALATSWIPGVDVITAALAEADNLIALVGTGMKIAGDAMQGHWGDALMGAGMLGLHLPRRQGMLGARCRRGKPGVEGRSEARGQRSSACEGGDPVDVVSGKCSRETDLELPGVLPLVLRRAYSSGYETGRLFGPGWSSTLDQRSAVNEAGIHFAGDDAQLLHYPIPSPAGVVLPRGARGPWSGTATPTRSASPTRGRPRRHFATVHHREAQARSAT